MFPCHHKIWAELLRKVGGRVGKVHTMILVFQASTCVSTLVCQPNKKMLANTFVNPTSFVKGFSHVNKALWLLTIAGNLNLNLKFLHEIQIFRIEHCSTEKQQRLYGKTNSLSYNLYA